MIVSIPYYHSPILELTAFHRTLPTVLACSPTPIHSRMYRRARLTSKPRVSLHVPHSSDATLPLNPMLLSCFTSQIRYLLVRPPPRRTSLPGSSSTRTAKCRPCSPRPGILPLRASRPGTRRILSGLSAWRALSLTVPG